jgi:hypothetical protein
MTAAEKFESCWAFNLSNTARPSLDARLPQRARQARQNEGGQTPS